MNIYLILRKSDNKPYVGQTSSAISQRLLQHINNVYVDSEANSIDAAIKKEGADKFEYQVLLPIPEATTEQLWFFETMYIDKYNSKENGFNKTEGNHKGKFDLVDYRNKHKVSTEIAKFIDPRNKISYGDIESVLKHLEILDLDVRYQDFL